MFPWEVELRNVCGVVFRSVFILWVARCAGGVGSVVTMICVRLLCRICVLTLVMAKARVRTRAVSNAPSDLCASGNDCDYVVAYAKVDGGFCTLGVFQV